MYFFFFKQKTAYEMRISDWSSDVCSSDLDEIGLTKRNSDGYRLLPDGRPLEIIVETAGENDEEVDVLELIRDSWRQIGVKLFTKPLQREMLRNRIFSGETVMAISFGSENGIPTPLSSPQEFVPIHQMSLPWPMWGPEAQTKDRQSKSV